jgi:methionyl-tRNA formyltransferase
LQYSDVNGLKYDFTLRYECINWELFYIFDFRSDSQYILVNKNVLPIYITLSIDSLWRSYELLQHLANLGPDVVNRALTMVENGIAASDQVGQPTMAPKIDKTEAKIDFSTEATEIFNSIRAFTYEPGAWTVWKGEPFKICATAMTDTHVGKPGEIFVSDKSVCVATGSGSLELLRVIPSGKREMDAIDWARGAHLTGGEIFG